MLSKTLSQKTKVLIVDDSKMVLSFHRDMVNALGFEAECVENGFEALELFATGDYAVIITDVNMARMDGYQLTEEIRKMDEDIPIIMVTTESQAHDKAKGIDAGADLFLVKPLEMKALEDSIKSLLA